MSKVREILWYFTKGAFLVLMFLVMAWNVVGCEVLPNRDYPPLPPGYVCAADDMDLRCPR